jgi:TonB family protein
MQKPLRSADRQPRDLQFAHFGVLNTGNQSGSSVFVSAIVNAVILVILFILSAAAVKVNIEKKKADLIFVAMKTPPPPPPPPPPKLVPPKPVPVPPTVEPKILLPKITPPELPKPIAVIQPKPVPVITPAQPKVVVAAAAPKPVAVNLGHSASLPNNSPHPTAVALGSVNNPIAATNRPATATVNLGNAGMAGMPPGTGRGPNSTAVNLGSGQPNGSLSGNGSRAVQGVNLGVRNGTGTSPGNGNGTQATQVQLGRRPEPAQSAGPTVVHAIVKTGPQVLYKPKPVYTAEATAQRIEGVVQVRIRVSASGAVTVLGVTSGLGHGLDESAIRAVQGTRFKAAVDSNGNPTDWEGVVNITFQIAQ